MLHNINITSVTPNESWVFLYVGSAAKYSAGSVSFNVQWLFYKGCYFGLMAYKNDN